MEVFSQAFDLAPRLVEQAGQVLAVFFRKIPQEAEALIATRLMQTAEPETALEQSWLLAELHERFGLSREELARRFSHSVSWVSRRLALVHEFPDSIQERVRRGKMGAHGAAK